MIQIDYAGIKVQPCVKWYELVVAQFKPELKNGQERFVAKITHFLLPPTAYNGDGDEFDMTKDVDFTGKCLRFFLTQALEDHRVSRQVRVQKVLIISDGGRADFKNSKFERFLFDLRQELGIDIEHHILAPNHGQGICDSAHGVGVKKLKYKFFKDGKTIDTPQQVVDVFNMIKNHSAIALDNDEKQVDVRSFPGINDCFKFTFTNDQIIGWADSKAPNSLHSWSHANVAIR